MRITQESDYALRVIVYLYELGRGSRIESRLISEHEKIPLRFLLKILRKLVHAGIVESFKGNGGGYTVTRAPETLSLKDVIEAIEGEIAINRCLLDPASCNANKSNTCTIHHTLETIQSRLIFDLDNVHFSDIVT